MQSTHDHPFTSGLISWYRQHARELPWRHTQDPYAIWLSEIILQQTRVAQGLPYYRKLLEVFPTVKDLAKSDESVLFRHWQGLGYYSRARNLHKAAKIIVNQFGGKFPTTYDEWIKLPGVGPYTAAAIASFAFGEVKPVVDGNVFRILARYFGIRTDILHNSARKEFTSLAQELIPKDQAAEFNQAIMDFGSIQCSPAPNCSSCPLSTACYAFQNKQVNQLPVKQKKTKQRDRYFNYFIFEQGNKLLVRERKAKDIWSGLWEFYLIESDQKEDLSDLLEKNGFLATYLQGALVQPMISPKVHILSHQKIHCQAWYIQVPDNLEFSKIAPYQWIQPEDFEKLGKSVLLLNLITDNLHLGIFNDSVPR
ncbi:A/G-specific adenine glycosylase [Aquirufa rosea]|uniref:Adenine DNA glycosylase n=1 Tax=Aquirufa rosea TaxID=2509241 RepID=A0A4Q1BXB7_9BACT|nr:A/G-specific adenine glycosylase [Aquirufa rosea]RXK46807.1 A/G-specific adenine glycosylase [Aquirufa rosea]